MEIFLRGQTGYDSRALAETSARLLQSVGCYPKPGSRVLVKPNLIGKRQPGLSCTRAEVVGAVCAYLKDCGAVAEVGDSPAFGSARSVAEASGLAEVLKPMGVPIVELDQPRPLEFRFSDGGAGRIGVSGRAMDADMLINLPKLKAHGQMRMTCAVKNFFGLATGFRKAWAHTRHGDKGARFESVIVEIMLAAPPSFTLLDGVEAMHERGPLDGAPYPLGLLAAAKSPVALDSAIYAMLGLTPDQLPLWAECRRRSLPGADLAELSFPWASPGDFDVSGFVVPARIQPMTFDPIRLVRGRIKSLLQRLG